MDLRPGVVVAGRYRVDQRVGAGGMGEVWAGEHVAVGTRLALKTMLSAAAVNHEVVARFRREAFLLGRVRSDYVARVVDFVTDPEFGLVLVMEFIEGPSLARVLGERTLSIEETIELGCDLAAALADLHRAHVVHRDLKPGNVILSPTPGGHTRAVIVDFGVSRLLSPGDQEEDTITGITRADMAVGTIEYMAPEQILNSRSVTGSSDIYAVGAMLFRAFAGHHIFGNIESESELAQQKLMREPPALPIERKDRVAIGLRDVVGRAVRKKPADRYRSAEEFAEALGPLRDLVRLAELDLDSTTHDVQGQSFEGARASDPAPPSPEQSPPSVRVPFHSNAPVDAPPASAGLASPVTSKSGVPTSVAVLLALLTLGAGLVGGTLLLPRLPIGFAGTAASPPPASPASAPPRPVATVAPSASTRATAVDPAESASATVEDMVFEREDPPPASASASSVRAGAPPRATSLHQSAPPLSSPQASASDAKHVGASAPSTKPAQTTAGTAPVAPDHPQF